MIRTWMFVAILALAVLPASSLGYAKAQGVNVVVSKDSVTLNISVALRENLTALPLIDTHITLADSTIVQPLLQAFNLAIQSRVPNAQISNIDIRIKSSNATGNWLLDENYSLTITGDNVNSGSNIQSNLAFIPMNLSQPMQVGQAEINTVGPTYLLPALDEKATSYTNLQYYIDGANPRNAVIPEQTTKGFSMLDFSWVSPVSTWTGNNDVLRQSSQWSFDPPSARYNLTLGVPSPEGPLITKFVAIYSPSMSLTVPANAWINGSTVSFDTATPAETLMTAIIVAALIIAISAVVLDRKLTGQIRTRKKR